MLGWALGPVRCWLRGRAEEEREGCQLAKCTEAGRLQHAPVAATDTIPSWQVVPVALSAWLLGGGIRREVLRLNYEAESGE